MKTLNRNKQTLYYANILRTEDTYDDNDLFTGSRIVYENPIEVRMNISPSTGTAVLQPFGVTANYDKVLITDDMNCPITETSILWIGVPKTNPHNFVVTRVAKSLNSISYGIREVDVSETITQSSTEK